VRAVAGGENVGAEGERAEKAVLAVGRVLLVELLRGAFEENG
jgi:hypothetical protein